MTKTSMGQTLKDVIRQAIEQGRLTSGVHDCAHLLEMTDPYNIMLCVLPVEPVNSLDVSVHIHHMLIEAFCREYDIRLIKAGSQAKLAELVDDRSISPGVNTTQKPRKTVTDTTCLILQYPENGTSDEDETLAEHYKTVMYSDSSQTCVIALPD